MHSPLLPAVKAKTNIKMSLMVIFCKEKDAYFMVNSIFLYNIYLSIISLSQLGNWIYDNLILYRLSFTSHNVYLKVKSVVVTEKILKILIIN